MTDCRSAADGRKSRHGWQARWKETGGFEESEHQGEKIDGQISMSLQRQRSQAMIAVDLD